MSTCEDFEQWYGKPLAELMKNEHAGFPVVMIVFPLLERYLNDPTPTRLHLIKPCFRSYRSWGR
jgi:hypothetical protein